MATGRAVSPLTEMPEDGPTATGSKTLMKRDSPANHSSNSAKLPSSHSPSPASVQVHSSLSSIDSSGAKGNVSSSQATETLSTSNRNFQVNSSSTSTDSEDESEQDNDDNAPRNKSCNLPKFTSKSIPLPAPMVPVSKEKTSNSSHERISRRMKHFQKLFKSVLKDQMPELIDSYVCAYQGDILLQGKMYITDRYLCFHSRIISYVTKHVHPWDQIERVTKERVAFIFPTAIGIKLKSPEKKLTYASFLQRDQAFEKILSIWSPFHYDSSSLSNHADDDEQRYASLPTSKCTQPSSEQRRKSNDELFYEAMDQFEQDPVIKLCFPTDKDQPKKKTKRRRRDKDNDDLSTSKKSPLPNHFLVDEPTNKKRQASPHKSTNYTGEKSLRRSDSSRDRLHLDAALGHSSSNSSLVTSNSTGFLSSAPRYLLFSCIALIKSILHYCIFLYNQWRISPMKISLVLLVFLLILILHSLYLIKLACRIEHRLQSLHHLWPRPAATSMPNAFPSLQ